MKVLALPEVTEYIENLVPILYEKGYFIYKETARKYVKDLYDDIKTTLPTRLHKPAPSYFNRYGKGMYYASFRKNRNTVWYAFFTKYLENGETIYLVRHISNNHVIAQYL